MEDREGYETFSKEVRSRWRRGWPGDRVLQFHAERSGRETHQHLVVSIDRLEHRVSFRAFILRWRLVEETSEIVGIL